LNANL